MTETSKFLVSVIIPNYNHARYLDQRIQSVLNQSYQHFEVIILDDCSTDNSREVIETYRTNPKVTEIHYNQENSGSTFRQWHKGLSFAHGEYVWIAESDDFSERDFLYEAVSALKKDKKIVMAYSESWLFNEVEAKLSENTWGKWIHERKWNDSYTADGRMEIATTLLYLNSMPNASAVVFDRNSLVNVDFSTIQNFKYAGDWMIYSKILETGKLAFISKPLNYFRQHKKSTRNNKSISEELERYQEIFTIIKHNYQIAIETDEVIQVQKFNWLFEEWVIKKSKSFGQRILLFKILPTFLFFAFTKSLALYYIRRIKNIKYT